MNRTDLAAPKRLRSTTVALGLGLACLLAWTGAATALMPPYVYENARNDAKSVIVIAVDEVAVTPHPFGTCSVTGTVKKVERGTTYSTGQKVELGVPCAKPNASPPLGGTIYQDVDRLKASSFGRAYLDAAGQVVLFQYEQLVTAP